MGENNRHFRRYVFAISDASGKTAHTVVQAALSQFSHTNVDLQLISNVRTIEHIQEVINKAISLNGIIIYTMVSPEFRRKITELGRLNGVPTVDILGPVLSRFSDLLEISPLAKPGLFRQLDNDYFKRIEALDYTIKHDDGIGLTSLEQAEIIITGVSRTSKTPVSTYLAYRGWKVANVPIVLGIDIPNELFNSNQEKIIALTITPSRLQLIRMERQSKLMNRKMESYTSRDSIADELKYGLEIFKKYNWPIIDTSHKSIEETATEIMRIIYSKSGKKKGKISDKD